MEQTAYVVARECDGGIAIGLYGVLTNMRYLYGFFKPEGENVKHIDLQQEELNMYTYTPIDITDREIDNIKGDFDGKTIYLTDSVTEKLLVGSRILEELTGYFNFNFIQEMTEPAKHVEKEIGLFELKSLEYIYGLSEMCRDELEKYYKTHKAKSLDNAKSKLNFGN